MKQAWTRYDLCDEYEVEFIAVSSDIMHIILYEHMTPIFQWELEEFGDKMYITNFSFEDSVEPDNANKLMNWVGEFISERNILEIIRFMNDNPELFIASDDITFTKVDMK